jgi:chromosomal replication initiation ATPase DnaA
MDMPVEARGGGDEARARLATEMAGFALGIPVQSINSPSRGRSPAAFGRQLAMYLCHVGFEMSLARVAAAFRRDRSTVGHACRIVEDRRDDPQFDAWVNALEAALREAPAPPANWAKAEKCA